MAGWAIPGARRRPLLLGVAVALALLVVVGRVQQGGLTPHRPAPAPAPPTTIARPLPVTATIRLGAAAAPQFADRAQLMVGEGRLWAMLDGVLVGVDPRNLHATARFPLPGVGSFPESLAVGEDAVWLLDQSGGWVWRVDLAGGRVARVRLPAAATSADVPSQLVVGEGAVWVLTSVESPTRLGVRVDVGLVRIDPHANRVSAVTPLANLNGETHQAQVAVGVGGVWVGGLRQLQAGLARAVIDRVDPASGRLRGTIETGDLSPAALAAGFGAVWLLRPTVGVLLRLDPAAM